MRTSEEILKEILEEEKKNKKEKKHNPHRHFEISEKERGEY